MFSVVSYFCSEHPSPFDKLRIAQGDAMLSPAKGGRDKLRRRMTFESRLYDVFKLHRTEYFCIILMFSDAPKLSCDGDQKAIFLTRS